MSGLLSALKMGSKALMVYQYAMRVIGNNISNANTPGYTRQEVAMKSELPDITSFGNIGRGVDIAEIRRIRDDLLDFQIRNQNSSVGRWDVIENALSQLEGVFNEPGESGLSQILTDFWAAWSNLASNPEDVALRANVREQANALISFIKHARSSIAAIQGDMDEGVNLTVSRVNQLVQQIADLNTQIKIAEASGGNANELRDERDLLIDELSELIDIRVSVMSDGRLQVLSSAGVLVDGDRHTNLGVQVREDGFLNIIWEDSQVPVQINGGKLLAYTQMRDEVLPEYLEKLDELANALIYNTNRVHTQGAGLTGYTQVTANTVMESSTDSFTSSSAGLPFAVQEGYFTIRVVDNGGAERDYRINILGTDGVSNLSELASSIDIIAGLNASIVDGRLVITADDGYQFYFGPDTSGILVALGLNTFFTGSSAADIRINPFIAQDLTKIAAGKTINPGDGENALEIAQLQYSQLMENGTTTINEYYTNIVGSVGADLSTASKYAKNSQLLLTQMKVRKESVSGVNLDEEMTNLINYQHTYTAMAKYISVVNDMLESLMTTL